MDPHEVTIIRLFFSLRWRTWNSFSQHLTDLHFLLIISAAGSISFRYIRHLNNLFTRKPNQSTILLTNQFQIHPRAIKINSSIPAYLPYHTRPCCCCSFNRLLAAPLYWTNCNLEPLPHNSFFFLFFSVKTNNARNRWKKKTNLT